MDLNSKYLAIDYGEKRVGIAISDEDKRYSFSREYIINDKNFYDNLMKIIIEENISRIIIGYPLNLYSQKTIQTLKVEEFKAGLENILNKKSIEAEILYYDERFTSRMAEDSIIRSGMSKKKRKDKGLVDTLSAQILLQDYIDKEKNIKQNN